MPDSFIYKQFELVSLFGNNVYFALLTLILVAAFFAYKKYFTQAGLIILTILSFPSSLFLKGIFKHTRPLTAVLTNQFVLNSYSFPSTHVVFYTVFFGYLIYLSYSIKKLNRFIAYFIRLFSMYFLFLIGISRVYLGMHWISDVVAGYAFGILLLTIHIYLDKTLSKNQKQNNQGH